jgi:hypothetical protein
MPQRAGTINLASSRVEDCVCIFHGVCGLVCVVCGSIVWYLYVCMSCVHMSCVPVTNKTHTFINEDFSSY